MSSSHPRASLKQATTRSSVTRKRTSVASVQALKKVVSSNSRASEALRKVRRIATKAALTALEGGVVQDFLRRDVLAGKALGLESNAHLLESSGESDDETMKPHPKGKAAPAAMKIAADDTWNAIDEENDWEDSSLRNETGPHEKTRNKRTGIFRDRSGWRRARHIACFEHVVTQLSNVVSEFWLGQVPTTQLQSTKTFRKQGVRKTVQEMVRINRLVNSLGVEVDLQHGLRQLFLGGRREERQSDDDLSRETLHPFWQLYHKDDIKRAVPAPLTGIMRASKVDAMVATGEHWREACDKQLPDAKLLQRNLSPRGEDESKWNSRHAALKSRRSHAAREQLRHRSTVQQLREEQRRAIHETQTRAVMLPVVKEERVEVVSRPTTRTDRKYFDLGRFLEPSARKHKRGVTKSASLPTLPRPGNAMDGSTQESSSNFTMPDFMSDTTDSWRQTLRGRGSSEGSSQKPLPKSKSHSSSPQNKLPPIAGVACPFMNPWLAQPLTKEGLPEPEAVSDSATMRYIRVCRAVGVIPTSSVLEMVHSQKIAGGANLLDDELMALTAMVRQLNSLTEVDLSGSSKLSDQSLHTFLNKLFGRPAMESLLDLDLGQCKSAGRNSINTVVSLLTEPRGTFRLVRLNLDGIQIPSTALTSLCQAIQSHGALRSVHLADTGMGMNHDAPARLSELLQARFLEVLGLGWNCFSEEGFRALGQALCGHKKLQELQLPNCDSCSRPAGQAAICILFESLSRNASLKILDVSMNRIGPSGAMVLEDALEKHRSINDLFISQNPLGVEGLRSILRLLSRDTSGLRRFEAGSCEGTTLDPDRHDGLGGYSATEPTGRYKLDLGQTHSRSLLRLLYKTCERFRLGFNQAFLQTQYSPAEGVAGVVPQRGQRDGSMYSHPTEKDSDGLYQVPQFGVLSFNFTVDAALDKVSAEAATYTGSEESKGAADRYLDRHFGLVRLRPSFRKVAPFLAQFRSLAGKAAEQSLLLDALSSDFGLDYGTLAVLCEDSCVETDVLCRLLHCVSRNRLHCFLALTNLSRLREYLKVYNRCERLLLFNAENPTGRYLLNLANPADYAVGERLMLLDRWEAMLANSKGLEDRSLYGNWSSVRNCVFQNTSIQSVAEWIMPHNDVLTFDYVSWRRPAANAKALSYKSWNLIMKQLSQADITDDAKRQALRLISDRIYVQALQVREFVGFFGTSELRVSAITSIFLRLEDPQNMKAILTRLDGTEWEALRHRLGTVTLFPFVQPEQREFNLDLSVHEDRVAASLAVGLNKIESLRYNNIRNPRLLFEDKTEYPFITGVPRSWDNPASLPSSGIFTFQYMCSAEERSLQARQDILTKFGGWNKDLQKCDIMWWTNLHQVPDAVTTFLVLVMREFKNDTQAAFRSIDGGGGNGNGVLSLQEFKTAVTKLSWPPFTDDPEKAVEIFRYLDPDGGGTISPAEWAVMGQLIEELNLVTMEVLQYVHNTFGDIKVAFEMFDTDGSNQVDFNEWQEAIQGMGFFGPTTTMYKYLSLDDSKNLTNHLIRERWDEVTKMWETRSQYFDKLSKNF